MDPFEKVKPSNGQPEPPSYPGRDLPPPPIDDPESDPPPMRDPPFHPEGDPAKIA